MLSKKPTYLQLVSLSGWTIPFKNEHKIKFAYFISNKIFEGLIYATIERP